MVNNWAGDNGIIPVMVFFEIIIDIGGGTINKNISWQTIRPSYNLRSASARCLKFEDKL